ncbi:plasmid recombination protein [Acidimangrovimonas pyrenivorans]|uniref:Plasmid recombination protein n=1 Tax=Acidimangrovimonas pyrenivorans TaxID=2030798 RepID=A0ABV7AMG3_9RHOB
MSYQRSFNRTRATPARGAHPVVLRFAELFPHQLRRYRLHNDRKQRDMDHVDHGRTHLNRTLIGEPDWFESLAADIRVASLANINQEVEGLQRAKRIGEAKRRLLEGPRAPWRPSKGGPLREFIVTAHRDWFEPPGADGGKPLTQEEQEARAQKIEERERQFETRVLEWLDTRFGDMVVHARADRDETTFHIHGVIAPWTEKHSKRSGRQKLLQPSSHPLLKDYEKAQDDIGAFFAEMGLVRGEQRALARRQAKAARKRGEDVAAPEPRVHVPAHVWRADEERRLAREAEDLKAKRARVEAERVEAAAARKQAELQSAKALAVFKRSRERKRDADKVLQVAEHLVEGHLVPGPKGGITVSQRLATGSPMRRRVQQLLSDPGVPARRLIARLGQSYGVFNRIAAARANEEVSSRVAAVAHAEKAVSALRSRMIAVLPERFRKHFIADTLAETREANQAIRALKKGRNPGEEDERR